MANTSPLLPSSRQWNCQGALFGGLCVCCHTGCDGVSLHERAHHSPRAQVSDYLLTDMPRKLAEAAAKLEASAARVAANEAKVKVRNLASLLFLPVKTCYQDSSSPK